MTAELVASAAPESQPLLGNEFGSIAAGTLTSLVGAAGVWAGVLGMSGAVHAVRIGWLLPLSGLQLDIDPLGGFFMALVGAVAVAVGPYVIGYARRGHLGPVALSVLPMFVVAMLLVPAAGSVTTFLLAWELMAVASLVLVLAGHTRAQVRSAALVYAVMTQLGFAAILVGLMVLSAAGDADRFADLHRIPPGACTAVFLLTMTGFGSKAGLVPLHAWLPGPPEGARPGIGADERGDGQPGDLWHLPCRFAAARTGSALVGPHLDGCRCGVGALWRGAGFGGHGP